MGVVGRNIAKHYREFYFGKNWTASSLKEQVEDMSVQMAQRRVNDFHTIAELVYHIHYYTVVASPVIEGGVLDADDAVSFDVAHFESQAAWTEYLEEVFAQAEAFAQKIEKISDEQFDEWFAGEKYGSTYRNIQGIVEHAHYHLGQIAMLKKLT